MIILFFNCVVQNKSSLTSETLTVHNKFAARAEFGKFSHRLCAKKGWLYTHHHEYGVSEVTAILTCVIRNMERGRLEQTI